ncbi:hypothetical protein BS329_09595 [Amycolatopsis coloradensis]|uniref:Uncharacterized protein n=1 Tax=Amycolatopsis coloradensis TaxID=76021 RepID=A0A1R0KVL1_9PSEU|nr:hypothetical protein BS329_09595 [Amycolatopsis coloradensis]
MSSDIETNCPEDDPDPRYDPRSTLRRLDENTQETKPVFGGADAAIAGWDNRFIGSGGVALRTPWGPKIETAFSYAIYVVVGSVPMTICLSFGVHQVLSILVGLMFSAVIAYLMTRPPMPPPKIPAQKKVVDGVIQGESKVGADAEAVDTTVIEALKTSPKVKTPDAS